MKKIVLFICLISFYLSVYSQKQICVDGNYSGDTEKGSPTQPYRNIQTAINYASNGDTIKVAKGIYTEQALKIIEKKVHLIGAYEGNGNFDFSNPETNVTIIEGTKLAPCILVEIQGAEISGDMIISGFTISNGERGIELSGAWSGFLDNIIIENNIIENNGINGMSQRGGGIGLEGKNIVIRNNILRYNVSDRGAAIGGTSSNIENFLISHNLIDSNKGYGDHGGAMIINGTGKIIRNTFDNNITAVADTSYGWGGAICIVNEDTLKLITLSHNIYRNNYAPDRGAAVFVDEAAKVLMEHELIYNNSTKKSGSAIYVDEHWDHTPSILYMNNCTISNNSTEEPNGAALFVQSSFAQIQNCIFWNNGNDFENITEGELFVEYTLMQNEFWGEGNISIDPLFADPLNGDFHLKSMSGRFNPISNEWVNDDVMSPAIDAGNPDSDFSNEIEPNGSRINLGCYGNTAEASKSKTDVGINEKNLSLWTISPNPAQENVTFSNLQIGTKLIITNLIGKEVLNINIDSEQININTANFEKGFYNIQIIDKNNIISKKLIIVK